MKTKIIAHCLVKNEERFIWYSIMSVLQYVDKIMVWDTGSTDDTAKIINSIKSPKISFKEVGSVDSNSFTSMRQKMIEATPKDYTWLMILDGDEIWSDSSIKKIIHFARNNTDFESIVVRTNNLVGDIYHKLPESAGHYVLAGHKGHLALRFINLKNIPGLHALLPHGQIGYFDKQNRLVQDRDLQKLKFFDVTYSHATHLPRSSSDQQTLKRGFKYKIATGQPIPSSQIPKVFFASHPSLVPTVTFRAPFSFWIKATLLEPLRYVKKTLKPPKSGY